MCFIPQVDTDQVTLGEDDREVGKKVNVCATKAEPHDKGALHEKACKRFSSWSSLRRAIATLITRERSFKMRDVTNKTSKQEPEQHLSPEVLAQATNIIIKAVQDESFKEEKPRGTMVITASKRESKDSSSHD